MEEQTMLRARGALKRRRPATAGDSTSRLHEPPSSAEVVLEDWHDSGCRRNSRQLRISQELRFLTIAVLTALVISLTICLIMLFVYDPFHWFGYEEEREVIFEHSESGAHAPRNASALQGLCLHMPTKKTSDELAKRYQAIDFVYTFINGTELNTMFRAIALSQCSVSYKRREVAIFFDKEQQDDEVCRYPVADATTGKDVIAALEEYYGRHASTKNKEADELRHSIRSIEKNIRWHRGRIVIVSPGHHPQWVDPAKNFLAGTCAGAKAASALRGNGRHLRVTTVHQDALEPMGMRLHASSNRIEHHMWKLRNLTPVHVYFNDDYFVNRPVAVTDFFNEYGGTIVRAEAGVIPAAIRTNSTGSWQDSVLHTNLFIGVELDKTPEDYLPSSWRTMVFGRGDVQLPTTANRTTVSVKDFSPLHPPEDGRLVMTAMTYHAEELPQFIPSFELTPRHFATHAPFVYCTNMHRYLAIRYEREFARADYFIAFRQGGDLLLPFLYNAFIMARPWVASPKFLPFSLYKSVFSTYATDLYYQLQNITWLEPKEEIHLNNLDGCAPATLYAGEKYSQALYTHFIDDIDANEQIIGQVDSKNPLFFNVNGDFETDNAANQLRRFLHDKFPNPVYLEHGNADFDGVKVEADLTGLYRSLMQLPLVAVTSFAEGRCPLLRSLQLALPDHRGEVRAVVHRFGTGEVDPTLREARSDLRHRVYNAMPCVRCAYTGRVQAVEAARHATLQGMVRDALASTSHAAAVALPAQCKGEYAGLRVRAIVIDAETPKLPVVTPVELRTALSMPGQTLALEDFTVMHVGPDAEDVALVLSRRDADARGVEWIHGASEGDLLLTFPVPYAAYEDLSAPVTWL